MFPRPRPSPPRCRPAPPTSTKRRCFNPCCRGSPSSTDEEDRGRPRRADVSILVVVDRPHRRRETPSLGEHTGGFQSLLLWIALIDHLDASDQKYRVTQFQSLLLWI